MQKLEEIKRRYVKLKGYIDEAGAFFRHKAHYSLDEQAAFIMNFYASFMSLIAAFEDEEKELEEGKIVSVSVGKTTLTKKLAEQEFDAAISVIYFNLSKDEIARLEERARNVGNLKEALVIKRLFDKYNT